MSELSLTGLKNVHIRTEEGRKNHLKLEIEEIVCIQEQKKL